MGFSGGRVEKLREPLKNTALLRNFQPFERQPRECGAKSKRLDIIQTPYP